MRTHLIGIVTLFLFIAAEPASANGGSGTRRSLRSSGDAQLQKLWRNRARSQSAHKTLRRSLSSKSTKAVRTPRYSSGKSSASKRPDAKTTQAREILQKRIGDALQAEILKNPGNPPSRERMQVIARQQLKQAQAEGVIPADADIDPSFDFLSGNPIGPAGDSLFRGGSNSSRRSVGPSRSKIHLPSRRGMYVPSRRQIHVPSRSTLRRRPGTSSRRVPQSGGSTSGLGLPDLTGGNATGRSPEQLQRQLQKLLK